MQFFKELQRRNVFRVAIGYIVSSWLLFQVADLVLENIGAPDWVMQTIMLLLALGFPVVAFFSWAYEVTPDGIKRESEVDRSDSITHVTGRKLDRAIVSVLVIALAYFAYDKFVLDPKRDAELVEGLRQTIEESTSSAAEITPVADQSIAVLPFVNMSADAGNEYFSDGITEELLNALSKVPDLRVTSRTSAFSFKGQQVDIPTLAGKLNVAHVLEGSVRKAGNRVRVTAQLIDARSDQHLWSETYDRELNDIFAIQDEISREVVKALQIELLGETPSISVTDTEAYTLYLKGMHFEALSTPENWRNAENMYRRAIEIDPDFAPAWTGLSFVLRSRANLGYLDVHEGTEAARRAAIRALELDDSLGDAWAALAQIQLSYDWAWDQAEGTLRTALQYGSGNVTVLRAASIISRGLGRPKEALSYAQKAVEMDPLNRVALRSLAVTQFYVHQFRQAEATLRQILELYPEQEDEKAFLASSILLQGRPEEAISYVDTESENFWHRLVAVSVFREMGRKAEAENLLQSLIKDFGVGGALQFAEEYALRGEPDEAFRWLDLAYEQRDGGVIQLITDPLLESLHDDPRWEEYIDRVGLLNYWREYQAAEA